MLRKFQFDEKLILFFLFSVLTLSFTIPYISYLSIFYVKIFLFIIIVLSGFSFEDAFSRNMKTPSVLQFFFLLTMLVFLISNFYFNIEENFNFDSLLRIASYFCLLIMFFFIFGERLRNSPEKFDLLTDFILYAGIILSAISFVFFILGIHAISQFSRTSAGLFGHPNTTSMFLTICIPVLFYKYFSKKVSFPIFAGIFFLFIVILLFTFSRAGYIGVGVGILVYTFYRSRLLFLFVLIFMLFITITVVLDFATSKVDSSLSRMLLISAAISLITSSQHSLLWGHGPLAAIQKFQAEKLFYGDEPVNNPHNLFLMLSMQFGVVFTLLLTITVFTLVLQGALLKLRTKEFHDDQRLTLSLTIVTGIIVQNFFEDVLVNPMYFFMPTFLVFAGYIYYSLKLKSSSHIH